MWSRVNLLLLCMSFVSGCQELAVSATRARRQPFATDTTLGIPYVHAFPGEGEALAFKPASGKGEARNMENGHAREVAAGGMCTQAVAKTVASAYLFALVPELQSSAAMWWLTPQHHAAPKIRGNNNDTLWHLVPEHYMPANLALQPGEF